MFNSYEKTLVWLVAFMVIVGGGLAVMWVRSGLSIVPPIPIPVPNFNKPSLVPSATFNLWFKEHKKECNICKSSLPSICRVCRKRIAESRLIDKNWEFIYLKKSWDYVGPEIPNWAWCVESQDWKRKSPDSNS